MYVYMNMHIAIISDQPNIAADAISKLLNPIKRQKSSYSIVQNDSLLLYSIL
jgi:hypothetical protein